MKSILSLAAGAARLLPAPLKQRLYHTGPVARLLRGLLNRAAPVGLSRVQVAAGAVMGAELLLDLQREKDYWLGTYELELQHAIGQHVRPGMVVYDVGANIGYVSLMLARAAGEAGQVFAFEALPANLERLRANLALNPRLRVTALGVAVIDAARPVEFLTHASGAMGKATGSAGRKGEAYGSVIQVEGLSLDDFVYGQGQPLPQVVKMDIEGGEVLALPGARRLLREGRPLVFLELHGPEAARAAWDCLHAAGYRLARMDNGAPIDRFDILDWKAYVVAQAG